MTEATVGSLSLALICHRFEEKGAAHEGQSDLLIPRRQYSKPGSILTPRSAQVFIVGNGPVLDAQGLLVLPPVGSLSKMASQVTVDASPPALQQTPAFPQFECSGRLGYSWSTWMVSCEVLKYKHLSQTRLVEGYPRTRRLSH